MVGLKPFGIKPLERIRNLYQEYPRQFWILVAGMFIDTVGSTILNPFLMLYVTKKFDVGMTEVGVLFGLMSVANTVGSTLGGALTDRLGRKGMMILGLVISGLSSLALGLASTFELVFAIVVFVGLFASIGFPAQQAMVADLLPEEKRSGGFGIFRVVANMAWVLGPVIGGLLAARSYMPLFVCDAVFSSITACIVLLAIRETRPARVEGKPEQTIVQTFAGYRDVLRDGTYVLFIGACILMTIVYLQLYSTLGVYLRDTHGLPEQAYGYLMSMNAATVVLLQIPIARRVARYRPMMMMALGTLLYAIGFGMYGPFSSYALFALAMFIITVGEMIVMPTAQALVARIAPEDMRGRYMAVFGFSWLIPQATGPLLAGLIMDNADPRWVWYAAVLVGLAAAASFILLNRRVEGSTEQAPQATIGDTPQAQAAPAQ
jgi:MFS family permease